MMRYVMMRIPGTHAPTKHRRSPGVHCTSLGKEPHLFNVDDDE